MHMFAVMCWFKVMMLCAYQGDAVGGRLNWKRNVKKMKCAGPQQALQQ